MKEKLVYIKEGKKWIVQLEDAKPFPEDAQISINDKEIIADLDGYYEILCDCRELFRLKESNETKEDKKVM